MMRLRTVFIGCLLVLTFTVPMMSLAQEETPEPAYVSALVDEALLSYDAGSYEDAIAIAQEVLTLDTGNLQAAQIVADSYRALGDDALAVEAYTLVVELAPDNPDGYFYRALSAYRAGDFADNEAILADLNNALEFGFYDRSWLYNVRGLTHGRLGNYELALEDYASALELSPSYAVVYSNRAYLLGEFLGQWAESMVDRKYVLEELDPNSYNSYNNLAWAYVQIGHSQEALGYANLALDVNPDDGNSIDTRGWAYFGLGDYDNAIADFERAIDLGITFSYYGLGAVYNALGETQTAIDYLNLYLENENEVPDQGALDLLAELESE